MNKVVIPFLILLFVFSGLTQAAEPYLTIHFEGGSVFGGNPQIELVSSDGARVLMDVSEPSRLTAPVQTGNVLLITHADNISGENEFIAGFPGEKLVAETGEIKQDGVYVRGIASSHNELDQLVDKGGSNYIFLVEIGGLRIANFGNIGQKKLSKEQLAALGQVDIALTPLYNLNNNTNIENLKGFNLMDQVRPGIVIPLSVELETAKYAVEKWGGSYWDEPALRISKRKLPVKTEAVLLSRQYGKICRLKKADLQ